MRDWTESEPVAVIETSAPPTPAAQRSAKETTALVSLVVVLVVGVAKLAVGLRTGSLGIVADASHSGLDFVASLLTVLAVRWADRPPDWDHPYGHGRGENLAALVQSLGLGITGLWIAAEATSRILQGGSPPVVTPWSVGVLVVSIGVSGWRWQQSVLVARQHRSAALAAEAANFASDVWTSLVVLLGVAVVWLASQLGLPDILGQADSVAALAVALVVVRTAVGLARETVDALVDRTTEGVSQRIAEVVSQVPGVLEVRRVRLRRAGSSFFIDLVIVVAGALTTAESHAVSEKVEQVIRAIDPGIDAVIHLEPGIADRESLIDRIYGIAAELHLRVHDVRVRHLPDGVGVSLHLEVSPSLSLDRAHAIACALETGIKQADERVVVVDTHMETQGATKSHRADLTRDERDLVRGVHAVSDAVLGPGRCHDVRVYGPEGRSTGRRIDLDLVVHCWFRPSARITVAHQEAERLERAIRERFPYLESVLVHVEPYPRSD
jgi:cation diffusion facilitator family transporter